MKSKHLHIQEKWLCASKVYYRFFWALEMLPLQNLILEKHFDWDVIVLLNCAALLTLQAAQVISQQITLMCFLLWVKRMTVMCSQQEKKKSSSKDFSCSLD